MKRPYDKRNRWVIDYVPVMRERAKMDLRSVLGAIAAGVCVAMMMVVAMYF